MDSYIASTNDAIRECLKSVQNQIECSFNNIDALLDSLFNNASSSLNFSNQSSFQKLFNESLNDFPQMKFENFSFLQQNQNIYKTKQIKIEITSQNREIQQIKNPQLSVQNIQQLNFAQNIQQSKIIQANPQSNDKSFSYKLLKQCQENKCFIIAISQDCSQLLAGCQSQIIVYEFIQGIMKQTQILNKHKKNVYTLSMMKKSKQFISGGQDNSIILWQKSENQQWVSKQILNGHGGSIYCIIINDNEDLIISGSSDDTIKFWMKQNEWYLNQTITDHSSSICGLSFNQYQNQIVTCSSDNSILIIQRQEQKQEWIVVQKIAVEQYGERVCFFENNMFAFSPYNKESIYIFEMDHINKQFVRTKDISIKCGEGGQSFFPYQYIKSKRILVSKNGEYINFVRKKQNGDFVNEQFIHFGTNQLYGGISEDGEYLITWDQNSKQIQIRRYQEE
ncbi:unnamed protein product [Paramecium octaurelia]|uniref:WD40-repeat-containing domain n=1 Tax=Paramecium octaurelia TaxID=43137 RepID=A0A8S1X7C2_PAROT|nr:unnamed protein product [Paramecium octaurelia]